ARLETPDRRAGRRVAGDLDRAVRDRLLLVVKLGHVDVGDRAHALAARAHPTVVDEVTDDDALPFAAVDGSRAARLAHRDVERERRRRTDVRVTETTEEDPQHRVRV